MKLALALTLIPAFAFGQTVYYLPETTLAAAQARDAAYCQAVGCDGTSTKYWWPLGSFALPQSGNSAYLEVWQTGQYGYPTNLVSGKNADLTPAEKSSLLTAAQVSPSFTQMGTQTVAKQTPDTVTVTGFTDPRGETLTYAATLANDNPLPAWRSFSPTGVFTGTPPGAGTISVTVTATDQSGFTASETFSITAQ